MNSLDTLVQFAERLADTAGEVSLSYFRQTLAVENKSDDSPVTIADRETEAAMRKLIEKHYPEHGLFGEEHGKMGIDREYLWVLDPIDGTRSFITGMPLYGNLISLLRDGRPQVGVINMPALGERWTGVAGGEARFGNQACRVSKCSKIDQAVLCSTAYDYLSPIQLQKFEALSKAVSYRRFGGDCYPYGLLASGFVDIVAEADLQPYDYFALIPVIEAAGGVITDWQGNALTLESEGDVLATATPELHVQALSYLRD